MAIGRNRTRQTASELVVEDLQGEIPIITCRRDGFGERGDGKVAFTRHISEVAAPVEQVHVDIRGIGKLDDEDFLFGNRADGIDVDLARQSVEAVEDKTDIRMIGATDDLPGVAVVADMAAPGKRLVAHPQSPPGSTLAKFMKVRRRTVDAADSSRRDVGADEHQIRSKLLHDVELLPARSNVRLRSGSGIPSKSRNG